ncbi:MAG TPA: hypothetical protein VER03_08495 [Bryobacteraceae bacterium]|nr:hypothetical protein [Bryobacteraceae bacterium]
MKTWIVAVAMAVLPVMNAEELAGEYAAQMHEVGSGLMLHANQTFEYFFSYGAADYMAKGTWRRDNDAVVLTSSGAEAKPFRVVRSAPGTAGTVRVYVVAPNGRGVPHMDVKLTASGGVQTGRTSDDGLASFRSKGEGKSVSIHVPVYDIEAGPFELTAGHNDVWLEINGEAITTLRFRDERLRVVDGALHMTYWKGERPLVYKKQ